MISFANPAFLWSLPALSIPLAIHLLSRKEGKVIYLGSLRHLSESHTKQSLSIRLNELLLLALRCILVIFLSLFISGLQWQSSRPGEKKWLLLEKGLEANPGIRSTLDSLKDNGYEPHVLATGFPLLKDSSEVSDINNYYDLIEDLKNESVTRAVIFSFNFERQFKGQRLSLPEFISWISVEPTPREFPVLAVRTGNDSLWVRVGYSNRDETNFQTIFSNTPSTDLYFRDRRNPDSVLIASPDSLVISLFCDPMYNYDRKIVRAAIESLQEVVPVTIKLSDYSAGSMVSNHHSDWIFWLSRRPLPPGNFRNKVVLLEDTYSPLFVRYNKINWNLTKRLNPDIALRENLVVQLAKMFFPEKASLQAVSNNDQRVMPEKMAWGGQAAKGIKYEKSGITDADPFLMLMILLVLFIERVIANNRKQ